MGPKIDWWNLPNNMKVGLKQFPEDVKCMGNFITIRRLRQSKFYEDITKNIICIKKKMTGNENVPVTFPILLDNEHYAKLYALMVSEGSYNTEFALHVPEKEFHTLFKESVANLVSIEMGNAIKTKLSKGILRSRAPSVLRKIIPFPESIPYWIKQNKEFSRQYLKVAFEAEGSAILNMEKHKRYIKLSRYVDITSFVKEEDIPLATRIYKGQIMQLYPFLHTKIKDYPPPILKDEADLLNEHFGIESQLNLEAIRKNDTALRCGKITARWVLFIYANNIDKFIREIGFLSKRKNEILDEMKHIKGANPKYSTLKIIKPLCDSNGYFFRSAFVREMKQIGYKSPSCYLWRFLNKGLIKRECKGYYQII